MNGVVRCLPAFYVVGVMKCGTTALYQSLTEHPRIAIPTKKEPDYLSKMQQPVCHYSQMFPIDPAEPDASSLMHFDGTPSIAACDHCAAWAAKWTPNAKIVMIMRNPIQRAYSQWRFGRQLANTTQDRRCTADRAATLSWLDFLTFEYWVDRVVLGRVLRDCGVRGKFRIGRYMPAEEQRGWPVQSCPEGCEEILTCLRNTTGAEPFWRALIAGYGAPPVTARVASWDVFQLCSGSVIDDNIISIGTQYPTFVRLWRGYFGAEGVHVLTSEDLLELPAETMRRTFAFLGLESLGISATKQCPSDFAGGHVHHDASGALVNAGSCDANDEAKTKRLSGALSGYEIPATVARRLRDFYQESVADLEGLLGRELNWLQ